MPYHATEVANQFIKLFNADGGGVKHVSLQKLIYIAHGSYLAMADKPLVADGFQAWDYGPVSPELYKACAPFGREEIHAPIPCPEEIECASELGDDKAAQDIIQRVYEHFKGYTPSQLITFTHAPDSPWDIAYENGQRSILILDCGIKQYFKEKYLKPKNKA